MNKKLVSIFLITSALTTLLPVKSVLALNSNAKGIIIPYVEDNGVNAVNIVDLAKAMHVEVKEVDGGIEMFINNNKVSIYDNDSTIYINGTAVPYKTTKMKDFETGEYYQMPIAQKPTKVGDGYLIPKTIIEDNIGIECESDGIHINDIKVQTASSVDSSASYTRSSASTVSNGWRNESGVWYYIKNGAKSTGWVQDNGKWYYLGADGKMRINWIQDGGNWYYLYGDGSMAKNTTIDGYYLGNNGAWTTATTSGSSGTVTGISYTELIDRMDGLGFVGKRYITASELYEDYGAYGWYWKDIHAGTASISDDGSFYVQLRKNDSSFHRAVLQIFNWLLPTEGNNLDKILTTNPQPQTLIMDGRTVEIKLYKSSILVIIKG